MARSKKNTHSRTCRPRTAARHRGASRFRARCFRAALARGRARNFAEWEDADGRDVTAPVVEQPPVAPPPGFGINAAGEVLEMPDSTETPLGGREVTVEKPGDGRVIYRLHAAA